MPISAIDLYRDVLPKTNCRECGLLSCLAFASMVISEKLSLKKCPYLSPEVIAARESELLGQYEDGKWTKRDMARDALEWARKRSSSMDIRDLPGRIGGQLVDQDGHPVLELPYFNDTILFLGERLQQLLCGVAPEE